MLADALKSNTSVTSINLNNNTIGYVGASALADALKVNTSVTVIGLSRNAIGGEGASALADALKVNTLVTRIDLKSNTIGDEGASALADALKVNTSVTYINLDGNAISADRVASIKKLLDRNARFRCLFLFDARQMLLSLMGGCADECSVVWPYLLKRGDTDGIVEPDNVEALRAEFEGVVAERRRRLQIEPEAN
jgi:hypothetical protein